MIKHSHSFTSKKLDFGSGIANQTGDFSGFLQPVQEILNNDDIKATLSMTLPKF